MEELIFLFVEELISWSFGCALNLDAFTFTELHATCLLRVTQLTPVRGEGIINITANNG